MDIEVMPIWCSKSIHKVWGILISPSLLQLPLQFSLFSSKWNLQSFRGIALYKLGKYADASELFKIATES